MKLLKIIFFSLLVLIVLIFTSCTKFDGYKIMEIDFSGNSGRVSYVDLRYINPLNQYSKNVKLKIEFFDENYNGWRVLTDFLTGQDIFLTDEYGHVSFSFLPKKGGIYRFRLINLDNSTAPPCEFSVNVKESTWGFLIWLAADNDLEAYSFLDLEEMKNQNPDVFVMVMHDKYSSINGKDSLMVLDENGEFKEIQTFNDDVNSGDEGFLRYVLEQFYSFDFEKGALVIWNHGNGWIDDSKFDLAVSYDFTKLDALTTKEIRRAIEYVNTGENKKLELLGFDACYMGTFEIAYELRNCARYFVASAFTEPAFGWNYTFMSRLNSDMNIHELAEDIVNSYFEFYSWLGYEGESLSLGVYDLSHATGMVEKISALSEVLTELIENDKKLKTDIISEYYYQTLNYYPEEQIIDPLSFLNTLCENTVYQELQDIKSDILNVFYGNFLVYKKISTADFWNTGLGLFLPTDLDSYQKKLNDMSTLDFYSDTSWKIFLDGLLEQ